jgi:amidase
LGRAIALSPETEKIAIANLRGVPFTQLANLTGVPAMSVPVARFADGLPLGIQFLAPHGGEGLLVRLAAQLEQPSWHAVAQLAAT